MDRSRLPGVPEFFSIAAGAGDCCLPLTKTFSPLIVL
jgi:hypothetical protein